MDKGTSSILEEILKEQKSIKEQLLSLALKCNQLHPTVYHNPPSTNGATHPNYV